MSLSDFHTWLYLHSDQNPNLLEAIGEIATVIFESTEDVVENAKNLLGEKDAAKEESPAATLLKNPPDVTEGFDDIDEGFEN